MTDQQRREAARLFAQKWQGKGKEDEDDRSYWIDILERILGVENVTDYIDFQKKVIVDGNTKRIDAYIPETKVLIEQKSLGLALDKPGLQSGGDKLTPYEQAKRYNDNLPYDEKARWIVTSNFEEIWIYDMNARVPEPETVRIENLQTEHYRLSFLVQEKNVTISKEVQLSKDAGRLVGKIYDAFLKEYKDPENESSLHSLNALCVRLVFCLYAEDSGIFGNRNMFREYMSSVPVGKMRGALLELFKVLDQRPDERDQYLELELAAFPYVNGGLFSADNIEIPNFTEEIRDLLLNEACDFDWQDISPTIFGAVFESTLNPETRRAGGMHYTSIENIHKVIDPLFLDDLKAELEEIKEISVVKTMTDRLTAFQDKLSSLTFLDPACGSGNFLTESYLALRRLENEVLRLKTAASKKDITGQIVFGMDSASPIKVSIGQFYGIEINDFAVSVAQTALWIAESQMLKETEDIVHQKIEFLPLKSFTNIVEGNALRIDWENVVPKEKLNYIMGNPPFVGNSRLNDKQKEDRENVFCNDFGELDYVACWYKKAADFAYSTMIKCAYVSTNSICQGQQVVPLWMRLFEQGIIINFSHRTFIWDSEAALKANVYCIIVGFSYFENNNRKLYDGESIIIAENINAYLMDAPNVFVDKRSKPLCDVPLVIKGLQPTDNGYLIIEDEEKESFIKKEPLSNKFIRPFITAKEYINGKKRWCLWLKEATPAQIKSMPSVKSRIEKCKTWREQQTKTGDAYKLKDTPALMRLSNKFHESDFIVLPRVTGERRRYVPFGFIEAGAIPGDSIMLAIDASLFHFGILCSNVHMAWMRSVCGRLKGDYRYSSDIVYNTFPWPETTDEQKADIEKTAQAILDARALYPDSSLADLYDPLTMPPELQKAHTENDKAVMKAYGFNIKTMSEADCVAELMRMYQELTDKKK